MKRSTIAGGAIAAVVIFIVIAATIGHRMLPSEVPEASRDSTPSAPPANAHPAPRTADGFLYGRLTTIDGAVYEGRLRWGGNEEAFWGDYFNGAKNENTWAKQVPPDRLPEESDALVILGVKVSDRTRPKNLERLFMQRFGDIARIEATGRDVRVTLKSGTAYDLDRFGASDFDDGLHLWDKTRGGADFDSLRIRSVEFLPTPALAEVPYRLHGTVHTERGDFTGFIQWDRQKCVGTDTIDGRTAEGEVSLRFDTIASIARRFPDKPKVTLVDGRELVLTYTLDMGRGNRGLYVDDRRYGRVLVSWDAFERVDFDADTGAGPAYGDFPTGRPLGGTVTTRAGARLTGRLVFDLDESETTETLDAPSSGVDYTIPFGLVASIVPGDERVKVVLQSGEELLFEPRGDLGRQNAGTLVFTDSGKGPEYLPWSDVAKIELDRPPATYPPIERR